MKMKNNKIIYSLNIKDIQNVAKEILDRKLNEKEIGVVIDKIGAYINWFEIIENAIYQNIPIPAERIVSE
jgi:hypothetical protein